MPCLCPPFHLSSFAARPSPRLLIPPSPTWSFSHSHTHICILHHLPTPQAFSLLLGIMLRELSVRSSAAHDAAERRSPFAREPGNFINSRRKKPQRFQRARANCTSPFVLRKPASLCFLFLGGLHTLCFGCHREMKCCSKKGHAETPLWYFCEISIDG